MSAFTVDRATRMRELLSRFKLPTVAAEVVRRLTDAGHDAALSTLLEVFEAEADERAQRRTERLRRTSRLPGDKTFDTLERDRLPRPVLAKLDELATGEFLERSDNVLCFGLPGRGKTHAAAALGHALVRRGHSVLFTPTFRLVQELLAAKRDLALPRALHKLDAFELLILDDIVTVPEWTPPARAPIARDLAACPSPVMTADSGSAPAARSSEGRKWARSPDASA